MKKRLLALLLAGVMVFSQTGMALAAENLQADRTTQAAEDQETISGDGEASEDPAETVQKEEPAESGEAADEADEQNENDVDAADADAQNGDEEDAADSKVQDEAEADAAPSDLQDGSEEDASGDGIEDTSDAGDEAAVQNGAGEEDAAADDEDAPDAPDAPDADGSDESSLPDEEEQAAPDDTAAAEGQKETDGVPEDDGADLPGGPAEDEIVTDEADTKEAAEEAAMNEETDDGYTVWPQELDSGLDVGCSIENQKFEVRRYVSGQDDYEVIDAADIRYEWVYDGNALTVETAEGVVPDGGVSSADTFTFTRKGDWQTVVSVRAFWTNESGEQETSWNYVFERKDYNYHGMLEDMTLFAGEKHHVDKEFTLNLKDADVKCTISSLSFDYEEHPYDSRNVVSLTQDEDEQGWVITGVREGETVVRVKFTLGLAEAETDFRVTVGKRRIDMRLVSDTGSNRLLFDKQMMRKQIVITPQISMVEYDWDTGEQYVRDTSEFKVEYQVWCTRIADSILELERFDGDFDMAAARGMLWDYNVDEENRSLKIWSKENYFDADLEVVAMLIDPETNEEWERVQMKVFADTDNYELDLIEEEPDGLLEWDQTLPPGGVITLTPRLMQELMQEGDPVRTRVSDSYNVTYRFEYHEGSGDNDPAVIEIKDRYSNSVSSGAEVTENDGPFTIRRIVNKDFDLSICAEWNDGKKDQELRRDLHLRRVDFGSGFIKNSSRGNPRYTWYYLGEEINVAPDRTKLDELAVQGYAVQTDVEAGFFDGGEFKPFSSCFFDEQNGLHVSEDALADFYEKFLQKQADEKGCDWRRLALRIHSELDGIELVDSLLQITITNQNQALDEFSVEFRNADEETMNDLTLLIGHKQELIPYVTCTKEGAVTVIPAQPGGDYYYEAGDPFYDDRVLSFDRDTWEVTAVRQGNTTLELPITIYDSAGQKYRETMAILLVHSTIARAVLTIPKDAVFYAAPGRTYTAQEILNDIQPQPELTVYSMRNPEGEELSIRDCSDFWITEVVGGGGKVVAEDGDNRVLKISVSSDAAEGELKLVIGAAEHPGYGAEAECRVQIQRQDQDVCTHGQVRTETQKATLTTDGMITTTCDKCGETVSTTKISHPAAFKLAASSCTYTGAALKPAVTVTDAEGKTIAASGYTVAYTDNVNAGKATATVTFRGNYSGSKALTFTIAPAAAKTFTLARTRYVYTGNALKPAVTVRDAAGKVIPAANYTVAYKNNVNAGTATAAVTLKGNYSGSKALTFTIAPAAAKTFTLVRTRYVYTGNALKPAVTVRDAAGKVIPAANYTVTYIKNKNPGAAVAKITMKGNYTGTKTLGFTINPKSTKLSALTQESQSVTVKWKKQAKQTSGYEIQYSLKSSFSGAKKVPISSSKTVSRKISGLKSGKKYYFRIRTYKKVGSKKFYSAWSKKKAVTVE